jgi:hypothetical protein
MPDNPSAHVTASSAQVTVPLREIKVVSGTQEERAAKWILDPLAKMADHEAFPSMMISIILIEKWLRRCKGHRGLFSNTSIGVTVLAAEFAIAPDEAFWFWQDWRNGLLHQCMPKLKWCSGYEISGSGPALAFTGKRLFLNPWAFRAKVIALVNAEANFWNDPEYALPDIFEVNPIVAP